MLDSLSVLLLLVAVFAWVNAKFFQISPSIAMMVAGLLSSGIIYAISSLGLPTLTDDVLQGLEELDFTSSLMNVVIGVLLYVTARRINFQQLDRQQYLVLGLAIVSTLINTFLTGLATQFLLGLLGLDIPLLHGLLFGALISPTDPIATISILKRVGLPEKLEVVIEGEALFNDGVGAVVFSVLAALAAGTSQPDSLQIGLAFVHEVGGGVILGTCLGYVASKAKIHSGLGLRFIVALAVIFWGGYLARILHVSYPLAMVVAGITVSILTGGEENTEAELAHAQVWRAIEDVLIAGLFLTIGLMALLPGQHMSVVAMSLIVPVVLFCRFFSVALVARMGRPRSVAAEDNALFSGLLTWGGLRGGISIALALSLPAIPHKMLLIDLAFAVVAFSVLVQAPTIKLFFPTTLLTRIVRTLD